MTTKQWQLVDLISLRLAHALQINTVKSSPLLPKFIAVTVTRIDMNVVSFLKYVDVTLTDKNQILSFYDKLVTQSAGFHIFLRPSDNITSTKGVVPNNMLPEVEAVTAVSLYTKLQQKDIIDKTYSTGQNLLSITTNGFEFCNF